MGIKLPRVRSLKKPYYVPHNYYIAIVRSIIQSGPHKEKQVLCLQESSLVP